MHASPKPKLENYESVQHRLQFSGIKKGAKISFHRHFKIQNIFLEKRIFLPFEWVSCGNKLQQLGLDSPRFQGFSLLVGGAPTRREKPWERVW